VTQSSPDGRAALWWKGARPRTLGASIVPVLVGAAAAGHGTPLRTVGALIVSIALQVGVNYANDYFDGVRRVDTTERVGPVRLTASGLASPRAVATAAGLCFGIAAGVGSVLALSTKPALLLVGVGAVAAAVLYSGGPKPYAGLGLGELFVFGFFGLAATVGTAYVEAEVVTPAAWWAAVPVGLLAVAILMANNIRDIATDAASGKRTLAVRVGDDAARTLYRVVVGAAFAAIALGAIADGLPALSLVAFLAAPLAFRPLKLAGTARGRELMPLLLGTAALHAATGLLLALGLWLA
jgi:1,4-dihydroxy-2-naphthoate polyprenyltransferase